MGSDKDNSKKPLNSIQNTLSGLKNMNPKYWVAFLLLIVLGGFLIFLSKYIPEKFGYNEHGWEFFVINELGILFISIVPMVFIYERVLRNNFLAEMKEKIDESIKERSPELTEIIESNIEKTISNHIPKYLSKIQESGIYNVYNELDYAEVISKLKKVKNTKIRILKIWIPSVELVCSCLKDAIINRNCTVEIILLNENCSEALEKRGKHYGYDLQTIKNHITDNIRELEDLYNCLPVELQTKIQLRLHEDFICVSLLGMENYFYTGLYLHGRVATLGTQIKVHGRGNFFYDEIYRHFKYQWTHGSEIYEFKSLTK
jgi:hypothetical protein